jgi:hypothetical protein
MRGPTITPSHGQAVEVSNEHEMTNRDTKEVYANAERLSGEDSSLEGQDGHLSATKSTQQDAR